MDGCLIMRTAASTENSNYYILTLHWRHNDHDGVSNHQPHGCLLNCLFGRRSKKTSKLRVTGLCAGNSPGPVNSPHKGPVTRKMFPFDDVIMRLNINIIKPCEASPLTTVHPFWWMPLITAKTLMLRVTVIIPPYRVHYWAPYSQVEIIRLLMLHSRGHSPDCRRLNDIYR